MDAELREFIRHALEKGLVRSEIVSVLTKAGWSETEISNGLSAYAAVDFPVPVPRPKPYLSPREVFLYLVTFGALYYSAYNLGALAFDVIDRSFPDQLQEQRFAQFAEDQIRWHLAALVVSFPLFLFMFRMVNNALTKDPIRRGSKPRRWLTYMTLFIAAFSLTADLTTLVYNALGGELTIRFLLKVTTVGVIAGGIFAYFLLDLRKDEA